MAARRTIKALLGTLTALLAVLIVLGLALTIYETNHVFIEGHVYPRDAETLNLRDQEISLEHFEALQESLPHCEIHWSVPFQGRTYPEDTEALTLSLLNKEEVAVLDHLKALKSVDARDCRDYEALQLLEKRRPDVNVQYAISIGGQSAEKNARKLTFAYDQISGEELEEKLPYFRDLQEVFIEEPEIPAEDLLKLREKFPELQISWEKTMFGVALLSDIQELDISGLEDTSLQEIKENTAYLPELKKLIMSDCGFDNETMAAFREEMRSRYKVVWTVQIGPMYVRTDETWFMPTKYHISILDRDIDPIYYCEDMLCVDLGHHPIRHVDWVAGMPHLKYLIVADGPIKNIEPLAQLQEVVWLELFMTDIRDITPLLSMKSVEDLNLARIPADLTKISEMKWVKNLWISGGWVPRRTVQYLRDNMPDTYIDASGHHNCCGRGWRQLQNYYDMRDLIGMPYFLD